MSKALKGRTAWNKGKKFSVETVERMKLAQRNRKHFDYKGKIIKICEECSKQFSVFPYLKDSARFCSKICKSKWLGKKFTGNASPRWKGGYKNRLWNNRQRRIKKIGNGGSHTLAEWENLKAQYNWTCPCCKLQEPLSNQKTKELTVDHIIPLDKGGSDNIENIQPLCRICNSRKHTKITKFNF